MTRATHETACDASEIIVAYLDDARRIQGHQRALLLAEAREVILVPKSPIDVDFLFHAFLLRKVVGFTRRSYLTHQPHKRSPPAHERLMFGTSRRFVASPRQQLVQQTRCQPVRDAFPDLPRCAGSCNRSQMATSDAHDEYDFHQRARIFGMRAHASESMHAFQWN
jgi:hypothetical protein